MKQYIIKQVKAAGMLCACLLLLATGTLTSCVKDDGSYDYTELPEISFQGIPEVTEVLAYIDHINISPKFVSSTEGEIKSGDPNWSVQYRLGYKGMGNFGVNEEGTGTIVWKDLAPASGFDLDVPAEFSTGTYQLWVTLTDNRNQSVTSKQYDVIVGSTTYEGWLVLCNEGAEERARLDMITKLSSTRTEAIHDIAKGLPTLHHATCINSWPQGSAPGDRINLFTEEGSYNLDAESLETEESNEFNGLNFAFDPEEIIIKEDVFACAEYSWLQKYKVCFSENGNAYVLTDGIGGAAYSVPINNLKEGEGAQFRVAPYCGYSWVRPWSSAYGEYMLFYDIDNKRFLLFKGAADYYYNPIHLQLNVIPDPSADEANLFSYSTGKDFVYMQSTRRSNGLVYTILQDPTTGKRSVYGINLGGSGYAQELYVPEVNAPDFEKATQFAFDNRFPLLFYSVGNKLYCYNLALGSTNEVTTGLGANEEITKIKFNLYRATDYTTLANQSEAFMNQQYRLVVCSYDNGNTDGGRVTFYDVDGTSNTATKGESYDGFAKIVDIIYRERTAE